MRKYASCDYVFAFCTAVGHFRFLVCITMLLHFLRHSSGSREIQIGIKPSGSLISQIFYRGIQRRTKNLYSALAQKVGKSSASSSSCLFRISCINDFIDRQHRCHIRIAHQRNIIQSLHTNSMTSLRIDLASNACKIITYILCKDISSMCGPVYDVAISMHDMSLWTRSPIHEAEYSIFLSL